MNIQKTINKTDALNTTGAVSSTLCAIHCALMPFVVTILPLLGLGFLANEAAEWILVALSAMLGISSLCLGFREHRKRRALAVLSIGLALVAIGRIAEHHEWRFAVPFLVIGALSVAAAHFINRALCRACRTCQAHQCEETP